MQAWGNWRVLMALRVASEETGSRDEWVASNDASVLNGLDRGLSAGLSVTF